MLRKIYDVAYDIKAKISDFKPKIALILGSGLSAFAEELEVKYSIAFSDIEGFPKTGVAGHSGKFLFGTHKGKDIVILSGRVHYYEGYPMFDVVMPIRVLKMLGIETLIVTNAAGGVNESFDKGDIMLIKDHISLFCPNPLIGRNIEEFGTRFPDMSNAYDLDYIKLAKSIAQDIKFDLKEGVYCYQTGPSYESASDVKAVRTLGGDSVGMSTVPEVIVARHAGIRVCGFSYIANKAVGLTDEILTHEDVMSAFEISREKFFKLLNQLIEKI